MPTRLPPSVIIRQPPWWWTVTLLRFACLAGVTAVFILSAVVVLPIGFAKLTNHET